MYSRGMSPTATPTLSDQLCFDLYATSRQMTSVYRPLLDEHGLTYPQYLVLLALWEHDGLSVKELAGRLQLDYGTISPLAKRLDAHGLVTRTRNPADERSTIVTLTPEGEALRDLAPRMYALLGSRLGLTADEVSTLRGLVGKVRSHLGDA